VGVAVFGAAETLAHRVLLGLAELELGDAGVAAGPVHHRWLNEGGGGGLDHVDCLVESQGTLVLSQII
jgi:hypothetical protein